MNTLNVKKMILIGLAAFAASSGAADLVQADKVLAEVQSVDMAIKSVELTESGLIRVTKYDNTEASLQLSKSNTGSLVFAAKGLADAELVTDVHTIVCMMMIAPKMIQELYVAGQEGELQKVLSAQSCAISHFTHPKESFLTNEAQDLKSALLLLAHQAVNN
jgi:hypothetical protein